MRLLARILILMLIASFAAGTAIQASAATAMAVKMAVGSASGTHMGMDDCKDCPDAGKTTSSKSMAPCASICALALMILPELNEVIDFSMSAEPHAVAEHSFDGHSGPPDPHPPRSIILS